MGDLSKGYVTVPAAATAMGVSRIVLERAIKSEDKDKALPVLTFHTGGKNGGFRLIEVGEFKTWLEARKGYHEPQKNGATKFHEWGGRKNPGTIVARAILITTTNKAA